MNNFVIMVVDDAVVNVKMAERFLKSKQIEIIDLLNGINEYKNVEKISIETFSGSSAGRNAVGRIKDETNQIDLVVTDLNMEDGFSGCTVIQEIVKRDPKIPVYVVSNSLSEFFRNDELSSCKTLQDSENGIVNVFKDCCGLPNIIGISKNNTGKLELNEIQSLFQKLVDYRKKNRQDSKTERVLGRTPLQAKNDIFLPALSKTQRVLGVNTKADNVSILPLLSKSDRVLGRDSTIVEPINFSPLRPIVSKAERVLGLDEPNNFRPLRPIVSKAERVLGLDEPINFSPSRPTLSKAERVLGRSYMVDEPRILLPSLPTISKADRVLGRSSTTEDQFFFSQPPNTKAERVLGINGEQNMVSPLSRRIRNMGGTRCDERRRKYKKNGKTTKKCRRKLKKM